ncbi:MAG: M28 family metallopeptidase [Oligoflexales bacterium]
MYKLLVIFQALAILACQDKGSSTYKIKRYESDEARVGKQEQDTRNDSNAQSNTLEAPRDNEEKSEENPGSAEDQLKKQEKEQEQNQSPMSGSAEENNGAEVNTSDTIPAADEQPTVIPSAAQILEQPGTLNLIQVDQAFIEQKLQGFTGNTPVLINNIEQTLGPRNQRAGKDLALQFLKQEYEALGFEVNLDDYGSGINFIAEKKGAAAESRLLILGAHYDSIESVGADDDASGIIGALAIAKALSNMNFSYTLRVLAFDEEELGLIGSANYANNMLANKENEQVIGTIILEMLGYDGNNDSAFHIVDCKFIGKADQAEGNSGKISKVILEAAKLAASPLQRSEACTDRGDHTSFWNQNIPAIVLSQDFFGGDSNPCYHDSCDTVDLIDYTYLSNVASVAAMTVASLLTPVVLGN